MDKLNIGNICGGALPELFDRALSEIVENIKDVNTSVDKKREMVIKITVQPASEFIFRVKQDRDGQYPTLALFEADGGAWKLEAMKHIAGALSTVSVPVVS